MNEHILATFTHRDEARVAADRARRELPGLVVHLGDTDDDLDAMALGQRAEMDESAPALPVGVVSGPLARGALVWGVVGLAVGALLTVPLALLIDTGELSRGRLILFLAMAGAFAGGTVAFVLGAGRQAVKEGATTPEDPTAVVRVDCPAERADEVIRFFAAAGARRAHFVDAPVSRPPTSEVERPRPIGDDAAAATGPGSDYDAGFTSDVR
jgi:hypothetical protein